MFKPLKPEKVEIETELIWHVDTQQLWSHIHYLSVFINLENSEHSVGLKTTKAIFRIQTLMVKEKNS